jgi:hypothetical protein
MMVLENSPAFAALPQSARQVFRAVVRAIGQGRSAAISQRQFRAEHGIRPGVGPLAVRRLLQLGLVEIGRGPRRVCVFRLSDRWSQIDLAEAERLIKATQPRRRSPGRRLQRLPGVMRASV